MNKHEIKKEYLEELVANGKKGDVDLKNVNKEVEEYWKGNDGTEIMYPITIRDLHRWYSSSSEDTEIGLCVHNINDPTKVIARWESSDSCSGGDFFILPKDIVEYWFKNIEPFTKGDCVVARIAQKDNGGYYVYFHLGKIDLKGGGGIGGDDLAKGVRVPAP